MWPLLRSEQRTSRLTKQSRSSEVGDVPRASVLATAHRDKDLRKKTSVPVRLYFILSMPGDYWNLKLYFEITLDRHKGLRNTELSHCPSHCVANCMTSIRIASSQGRVVCAVPSGVHSAEPCGDAWGVQVQRAVREWELGQFRQPYGPFLI